MCNNRPHVTHEYDRGFSQGYSDGHDCRWLTKRPAQWSRSRWRGYQSGVQTGMNALRDDLHDYDTSLYAY